MGLFRGELRSTTDAELQALVREGVSESKTLDYKRDLIGRSDADKREFLADVTAFANTVGGLLIIGIEEAGGVATRVVGIDCENAESEILRLEQILRSGVRPPLQGLEIFAVPSPNGPVLLIRVPESWNRPHQVGHQGSVRFFGRGSQGKFQLEVEDLREMFQVGPALSERIRSFRINRVTELSSANCAFALAGPSWMALHFVPICVFSGQGTVDFKIVRENANVVAGNLIDGVGRLRHNIDGAFATRGNLDGKLSEFAQLHRNGVVEYVEHIPPWEVSGVDYLPGQSFDETVHTRVASAAHLFLTLSISGPVAVLLTLVGMKGRRMGAGFRNRDPERQFDRDQILCGEVMLSDGGGDAKDLARELLDLAWNASGFERSLNYDAAGKWKPARD